MSDERNGYHVPPGHPAPRGKSGVDTALRLMLPIVGLVLIVGAMALAFFRPDLAGTRLYYVGGLGLLLFLTIFLTWEKGNLLNFLHLGIYCALVAGSIVLIYLIADNHPSTWDLTQEKIHSLSAQTVNYLKKLPQPVRIVAFTDSEGEAPARHFLDLYRGAAPERVKTEVHDLVRENLVARQYDPNVYPGDFYVIREESDGETKRKKVSLGSELTDGESRITNAIIEIMREQTTRVYFLTGHGEKPLTQPDNVPPGALDTSLSKIRGLLEERAFPCEELNLLQRGVIPDDAALLVVPGPTKDLFDLERDMIDDYLANGGKLFVLFDPVLGQKNVDFMNLRSILAAYGIDTPPNSVVVDLTSAQLNVGALSPVVQEFGRQKIMEGIPRQAFILVEARPIDPASPPPGGVTVTSLFSTGPSAWSLSVDDLIASGMKLKQPAAGTHAQSLAVAAEKKEPGARGDTRLVVVGDSDVFTNAAVDSMTATLFFQTCNWLAEQEDLLSIPPKVLNETPILLQGGELLILSFSLGLLVMIVLFGGLGFTVLRRKMG